MTDDINKKISIDIDINSDGQQTIDQYKVALDNLRITLNNLNGPLKDISNNINGFNKTVSSLSNSSDKSKTSISDLASSFTLWNKIIELFRESFIALNVSLSAGISILITYGPEILKWIGNLLKGNTTLTALNKTLKDNKLVMDAVNQATLQGSQNAQDELVHLKLLYIASQDHNLSLAQRKKAVEGAFYSKRICKLCRLA